ncbi:hypothetical protein EHE19_000190 [Ruminiclostridium herbifermentans]|uniref:Uncharacterized protein n=1 Tax=Ruminiclostridium herbifermentans TaxID=2488810 RepID=A0A4U7JGC2_9FIRM|nr:hypothetical protein [Ruminiclostridium herbifermentans]QNU67016.1 hypothetical protein EHE19_000190 [Ruminiclostridium herbifermentans]
MFRLIKKAESTNKQSSNKDKNNQQNSNNQNSQNGEYTYASMRKLAFTFSHKDMGAKMGNDYHVYGAVVDMGVDNINTATMICFIDGTTSLYFSDGGGIIGAGQHESVNKAVLSFLENCFQALPITRIADGIDDLPKENHHTYYLFTKAGIFSIDIDLREVNKSKESQLLYTQSQMVLNEILKVSKRNG